MTAKLKVGLIGLGRLGQVYAAHLAHRVQNADLAAVADIQEGLAEKFSKDLGVSKFYTNHQDLIADKDIDAIAVISTTSTHRDVVIDAANHGKAVFCEKPVSISLSEANEMRDSIRKSGTFFQIGFQRRFNSGYLEALDKLNSGVIGDPVLLKSSSRDPFAPPMEFCDPAKSGGLLLDMGIHDFDAARMFMGEVKSVYSIGNVLAYPEMKKIGDIDNAVVNMYFENGSLGVVDLSRNAVYGYDIRAEILGTKGTLKIGYLRETPLVVMTKEGITHDVVPHFMERFGNAYLAQIQNFADNVLGGKQPAISIDDGITALEISLAAAKSFKDNCPIEVKLIGEK